MKRKLMIIAAAIMLVGGYAVYTTVENSILIQNVLANGTGGSEEGEEGGGLPVVECFSAASEGSGWLILCSNCKKKVRGTPTYAGEGCK